MPLLIVILIVIIGLVAIVALLQALWRLRPTSLAFKRPRQLNERCRASSDCEIGLTCDQSRCLIPPGGSCVYREDMCSQNGSCEKGSCQIKEVLLTKGEADPLIRPALEEKEKPSLGLAPIPELDEDEELNPTTFHSLELEDGTLLVENENILDASLGQDKHGVFVWYAKTDKIGRNNYLSVVSNKITISTAITGDVSVISCQAFGRICYLLLKDHTQQYSIRKYSLTSAGHLEVAYPELPPYPDVANCINLGVSDKNVIMIVTEESIISFNKDSLHNETSSWHITKRDNSEILYLNYLGSTLFGISQERWFYGDLTGRRESETYPVLTANGVENKPYWSKRGLRLA